MPRLLMLSSGLSVIKKKKSADGSSFAPKKERCMSQRCGDWHT